MGSERSERDGAVVALMSVTGMSLVVFPEAGTRAALPKGTSLAELSDAEFDELRASAVPATVTERFFRVDPVDGANDVWWLVQQTGPAWAEPAAASADACGLLFTRLDGSLARYALPDGRPPGPLPDDDELRRLLHAAVHGPPAGGAPDA